MLYYRVGSPEFQILEKKDSRGHQRFYTIQAFMNDNKKYPIRKDTALARIEDGWFSKREDLSKNDLKLLKMTEGMNDAS